MNYANMIEEKRLKKAFIIATLASTIMGSFSAGIALYDRVRGRSLKQHTGYTDPPKSPQNSRTLKLHGATDLQDYLLQLVQDVLDGGADLPPRLATALSTAATAHSHKGGPDSRSLQDWSQRMLTAVPANHRVSSRPYAAFCPYSLQLQLDPRCPLEVDVDGDPAKAPTSLYCPCCAGRLAILPGSSWKMHKLVVMDGRRDHHRSRVFTLTNRFVVKCHQPAKVADRHDKEMGSKNRHRSSNSRLLLPTYACCLCWERRRQQRNQHGQGIELPVASFSNMSHLVRHVCDAHSLRELLADPDIQEMDRSEQ